MRAVDPTSVLFITLDSCRYDTFEAAAAPNLRSIGPLHRATAPANFTFGSHMAMFVGFTPGVSTVREPWVNPKFSRVFKLVGAGIEAKGGEFASLPGVNVIDGFRRLGYYTVGVGAVRWFNPTLPASKPLVQDFDNYLFTGQHSLRAQIEFVHRKLDENAGAPAFAFMNVGETHVPYYHRDAPWSMTRNPCVPFSDHNDAEECRRRQTACVEWVDRELASTLERFADANVYICADHGDAWGEDGLWEHGIHHEKVLEVPLLFRLQHPPKTVLMPRGGSPLR